MIPKIIHWCWFSKEIPTDVQNYVDGWKRLMPDYEIIRWNADNFDIHSVKWVEQAVEAKKWAFAADYIRLWAVYNYGGIYLDSDVEVLKPFDDLLELPYFLGLEVNHSPTFPIAPEMGIFGSLKNASWLKLILDYYENRIFTNNRSAQIPIPHIVVYVLSKHKYNFIQSSPENFDYNSQTINLFSSEYFSPKYWLTKENFLTEKTYSIHHFIGSWREGEGKLEHPYPEICIQSNKPKLYIWGTGEDGVKVLNQCKEKGWKIDAFLDSKAENGKYTFEDHNCIAPIKILERSERDFFIIVSSRKFCREIYETLKSYNFTENEDFWLPFPGEFIEI